MSGLTRASNHFCNLRKRKKQEDKMKALKLFLQLCLVSGICVIIGFSWWLVYFVWWIIEGMM